MARNAHGWSNDETWQAVVLIDNNRALEGEVIAMASLLSAEAISGGAKTQKDIIKFAVPRMAQMLRVRFTQVLERVQDVVYTEFSGRGQRGMQDARTAERDIAGGIVMLAKIAVQNINWHEVAERYVGE